jgi:hypothetical protein
MQSERASFIKMGGNAEKVGKWLLISQPKVSATLSIAVSVTVMAAWLLLGSGHVYSAEMTWDLLFNLDGAWRLYNGQLPHIDFHTELGSMPFALTALSFNLTGPSVLALPVGECLLSAVVLLLAIFAANGRLPLIPAVIFSTLCSLIILMPLNYGDTSGAYSFAMAYNRFGWSISTILFAVLFIEPLPGRRPLWKDCFICLAALLLVYYVKITYFAVGIAGLALAILLPGYIGAHRRKWVFVFVTAGLFAVAPFNIAYLQDIVLAALAGGARTSVAGYFAKFVGHPAEYALAMTGCLLVTLFPRQEPYQNRPLAQGLGALFLLAAGAVLITQNAQSGGIPIYAVISLLVYRLTRDFVAERAWPLGAREYSLLFGDAGFPVDIGGYVLHQRLSLLVLTVETSR